MKTVWSWIVIFTLFGVLYYAADNILTDVESTIDSTVKTNVVVAKRYHMVGSGTSQQSSWGSDNDFPATSN